MFEVGGEMGERKMAEILKQVELESAMSELRQAPEMAVTVFQELKKELKTCRDFDETFLTAAKLMLTTTSVMDTMERVMNTMAVAFLAGKIYGQKCNEIESLKELVKV